MGEPSSFCLRFVFYLLLGDWGGQSARSATCNRGSSSLTRNRVHATAVRQSPCANPAGSVREGASSPVSSGQARGCSGVRRFLATQLILASTGSEVNAYKLNRRADKSTSRGRSFRCRRGEPRIDRSWALGAAYGSLQLFRTMAS